MSDTSAESGVTGDASGDVAEDADLEEVDIVGPVDPVEDVEDVDEVDGNRLVGAVPKAVLEYLARSIVDEPDAVVVEADDGGAGSGSVSLRLHVAPSDMGRVIGRRGRVAQAIRTVVRAAGAREGLEADVDIVD